MVLYEGSFQGEIEHLRHLESCDTLPDPRNAKPRRILHLQILKHVSLTNPFLHGLDRLSPPNQSNQCVDQGALGEVACDQDETRQLVIITIWGWAGTPCRNGASWPCVFLPSMYINTNRRGGQDPPSGCLSLCHAHIPRHVVFRPGLAGTGLPLAGGKGPSVPGSMVPGGYT